MLVMFVTNNFWPPIVTDQLCVTVTAYLVSDEHLYCKQQQEPSATATADVMTLETDAQMSDDDSTADRMDTDSDVSSPEQTIKDLQLEIRRLKRQVPDVYPCDAMHRVGLWHEDLSLRLFVCLSQLVFCQNG